MEEQLPTHFMAFTSKYPDIAKAYYDLGEAVHQAGPLDEKTRALVKCALAGAARLEGGFHAQVRKAKQLGISIAEVQHVALLALPTLGFPHTITLLSWINDVYGEEKT